MTAVESAPEADAAVGTRPDLLALPRVNLLPPEIGERRRLRHVQYAAAAGVVATLGLAGALYAVAAGTVSDAEAELAAETTRTTQLQAAVTSFAGVTEVYARSAAAQQMLATAMGDEVRYSRFLNDLSLTVPEGVWVKNVTVDQGPVAPSVGDSETGIGTVTVTGVAFGHDDLAVLLERLADQPGLVNPYFSSSTEVEMGPRTVVEFATTATLTPDALSRRYHVAPEGS